MKRNEKAKRKRASKEKESKKEELKKEILIKPEWKTIKDADYREYFVTQAQLSKSIRKDNMVYLTFYDEQILPLQGKTKKPLVERKIKTTLIIPEKALQRIAKFLNNIVLEESKTKSTEEHTASENTIREDVVKPEEMKVSKVETTYIR